MGWEFGISTYKLLHVGQVNNEVLLYILNIVLHRHGKEHEQGATYMYSFSLCCTVEANTLL